MGSIRLTYQLQLISISNRQNQNISLITKLTQSYSNLRVQPWQLFVSIMKITKEKAVMAFRSNTKSGVNVSSSRFYKCNNVSPS